MWRKCSVTSKQNEDDFEARRGHLENLTDEALHAYFWELADKLVAPLVEEARTHTSPSIERSVLLRMGFSSLESQILVEKMLDRGLLGHGAGALVLRLAQRKGLTVRAAGLALIEDRLWNELS